MSFALKTKHFWRAQLPHWEVEAGFYFITVRCAGTLPKAVTDRLRETQEALAKIEANSTDFEIMQRRYFQTVEKYSDSHQGFCPFRNTVCAQQMIKSLPDLAEWGWNVPNWVIMPNHIHIIAKTEAGAGDMKTVLSRWKGKTSRLANKTLNRSGSFWQRDWFDRVVRHEAELKRTIEYIRQNPVKAKLCSSWQDYPWVR